MYGQGDAPFRRLYVDESGRYPASPGLLRGVTGMVQWVDERTGKPHRGLPEPQHVVAVPSSFNMDSIAYNTDVIKRRPEQVSWAELLNSRWKGRVALFGGGQLGLLDAANAAEAAGLMRFRDKGDMSRGEIDRIVKILVRLKKSGHFYGLWDERTSDRAVEFMLSRQVVVESMWSPQVTALLAKGFPVRYAAPPEGYRGWAARFAISSAVKDPARLQAAYDYANWWLSGPPGALTMRFGFYNAVQATTRRLVSPADTSPIRISSRGGRAASGSATATRASRSASPRTATTIERSARASRAGRPSEGSCRRIACSNSWRAGPGSRPSSSTSTRRAAWYASSASACRPER
jgi:spermidine/putrescine-binding protein